MPLALSMLLAAALAQAPQIDEALLENFTWRSVGPAGAGGRVVDVEVVGEFPFHIVIVYRSGLTKGTGVLSGARRIDVTMSITRIPL